MPELNPLSNEQIFLKKIAENTGSDYNTGDVSEINPLTIDQILLKEIAANTAEQSGDITELEEKVADNAGAIEAIVNVTGAKNLAPTLDFTQKVDNDITWTVIRENGSNNGKVSVVGTSSGWSTMETKDFYLPAGTYVISDSASSRNTYVELKKSSDASKIVNTADGDSQTFTLSQGVTVYVIYAIRSGVTVNDVFACMIRDARITDPTYVPYAMTNRELTDAVNRGSVSVTTDGVKTYKQLLCELFSLATYSRIFVNMRTAVLDIDGGVIPLVYRELVGTGFQFGSSIVYNGTPNIAYVRLHETDSSYETYYDGVNHVLTDSIPSGRTYTLYF